MKKILIVDDHLIVRQGLKQFINGLGQLTVGGEAGTGTQALQLLSAESWDMVVLDLSLKDVNGLELLKTIRRQYPALPVLILTAHGENSHALAAIRGGAAGYITKDSPTEELQLALLRVAGGQTYLGPQLTQLLANGLHQNSTSLQPAHESLSKREFEVLLRLGRGTPLTRIAEQLSLNAKTVSTYRARIMDKLSLQSNADIVRYVDQHGLDPGGCA
ncbi:MAG: response regulator transcription factor [Sterolibacteriaceae bacterium MAG5]|nr:response regulator transcription factor [Candidatus Nitricoxidireducens bremensis]